MTARTRAYARRVDVNATPQRIWQALTDNAQLAGWCSPGARIAARAAGIFRAKIDRVTELEAHIDVFDPARRLRLIHLPTPAWPPSESVIIDDLILEAAGATTLVRLLGSGVPGGEDWDTSFNRLRLGWERALARLKLYCEKEAAT
jgi:uncharacterized protein YndB with AHSA1/START domain